MSDARTLVLLLLTLLLIIGNICYFIIDYNQKDTAELFKWLVLCFLWTILLMADEIREKIAGKREL